MAAMRWPVFVVLSAVCLVALHTPAWAQQSLSRDVTQAESVEDQHRQQIENHIDQGNSLLQSGDNEEVVSGRKQLISPFTSSPSDAFRDAYAGALGDRLETVLAQGRPLVRLNAMVVAGWMNHPRALGLGENAATDEDPRVRYWGAKVLRGFAEQPGQLGEEQRQQVRQALDQLIEGETVEEVNRQAFVGLAALDDPQADQILIGRLDNRVQQHAEDLSLGYVGARAGLEALHGRLANTEEETSSETVRELARVTARYLLIASEQLAEHQQVLEPDQRTARARLAVLADEILNWAVGQLDGEGRPQGNMAELIDNSDWQGVHQKAQAWAQTLTDAPFNFSDQQIAISTP
jgi:hypothetical protein